MADEDLDLDVAQQGGKKTKLIVIILVVVVLVLGGVVAWLMMSSGGDESTDEAKEDKAEITPSNAIYHPLKPTFIINFADASKVAYLQVDIEIMAFDQGVIDAVQEHMPVVRNNILLVLGSYSYDSIKNAEGKEKMREEILASINEVLSGKASKKKDEDDKDEKKENNVAGKNAVQQVYFTSFIMQ